MQITLHLEKYIADPYRISRFRLIEIQKESGMMRARSEKKRRECLESYLQSKGMTLMDYENLKKEAEEPFWINADGFIYIPKESVHACFANANDVAPSRIRIQNLRSALRITDFVTNKKKPDGVWERFAVVKSGMGKQLSNQRGLRTNAYIEKATAKGEIDVDADMVKPDAVKELLSYAGKNVGIGASRKLNYGRFSLEAA